MSSIRFTAGGHVSQVCRTRCARAFRSGATRILVRNNKLLGTSALLTSSNKCLTSSNKKLLETINRIVLGEGAQRAQGVRV